MKRTELIKIIKEEIDLYDKIENTLEKVVDIDDKVGDVWDELADLLEELLDDDLEGNNKFSKTKELEIETSLTGGEEYDTPNAFSVSDKDKKKRDKKAAKITGGTIIKEEITSDDWSKLKKIIRMEIASLYFTLYKKRNVWIKG